MSEVFIATEPDGSKWVSLEEYQAIHKIAVENKLVVEQFQKLLGVYTTTSALAKVVELMNERRPTQRAADGCTECGEPSDLPICVSCQNSLVA